MIMSGSLKTGERVASVRDVAATLAVNPLTVQKAYGELERDGLLEMRRGLGMFVADGLAAGARPARERREASQRAAHRFALEAAQAGLSVREACALVAENYEQIMKGIGT